MVPGGGWASHSRFVHACNGRGHIPPPHILVSLQIPGTTEWMAGPSDKGCTVQAAKGSGYASVGGVSTGVYGAAAMEMKTGLCVRVCGMQSHGNCAPKSQIVHGLRCRTPAPHRQPVRVHQPQTVCQEVLGVS